MIVPVHCFCREVTILLMMHTLETTRPNYRSHMPAAVCFRLRPSVRLADRLHEVGLLAFY